MFSGCQGFDYTGLLRTSVFEWAVKDAGSNGLPGVRNEVVKGHCKGSCDVIGWCIRDVTGWVRWLHDGQLLLRG